MTRGQTSVLVLALAGAAFPAVAQDRAPTGSIIATPAPVSIPDGGTDTTSVALQVMRSFGRCAAEDQRSAAKLLGTVPGSGEEHSAARWLAQPRCLSNGQLQFQAPLLRGVVAEYLFKETARGDADDWARLSVFTIPDAATLQKIEPLQRTEIVLVVFGQCVAGKDMASVRDLLDTKPAGGAETAAFAKLRQTMGNCAEQGVSFKLNRFQMRGYLAEGAYRTMIIQSKDATSA